MTLDEATKLQFLSSAISIDVVQAMRAAIVKGAADMLAGNKPEWFSTPPANSCSRTFRMKRRSSKA